MAEDYYIAISSVERRLALLGEDESKSQSVTTEERAALLEWPVQLAQPKVADELRLEIAFRMRQVLTGPLTAEHGMDIMDHPPPAFIATG